jgi:hypothetical protein
MELGLNLEWTGMADEILKGEIKYIPRFKVSAICF